MPGVQNPHCIACAVTEGLLEGAQARGRRQAFDGGHGGAVELDGEEQAAPRAAPVHEHGAGAAHPVLAAHVRAREHEIFAEKVGERAAGRDLARDLAAVHGEPDGHALGRLDHDGAPLPMRSSAWPRTSPVRMRAR